MATARQDISTLMDGELEPEQVETTCVTLVSSEAIDAWARYHLIGDVLRGDTVVSSGFFERFSERLAREPTVLAPRAARRRERARVAWAVAASAAAVAVVGWVAMTGFEPAPSQFARATVVSTSVPIAQVRRNADVGHYVLVHQQYSPATVIQGVQPYIRAVTDDAAQSGR